MEPINCKPMPFLMQQAGPAITAWDEEQRCLRVTIPLRVFDPCDLTWLSAPSPPEPATPSDASSTEPASSSERQS